GDGRSHQLDVRYRRAAAREAGRRLDEVRATQLRQARAARDLLVVEETRLENHLRHHAVRRFDDAADVVRDAVVIAVAEGADVHHHVELARAVRTRLTELGDLRRRRRGAMGVPDDGADGDT